MPDIRYVCLSDTHFGAETSLLTNLGSNGREVDPTLPSPVLEKLVGCLKDLIGKNGDSGRKPTLVLNGDILELALAQDNLAAMAFERFIEKIMPPGAELFDRIVYNPGNHDHHLWESARETQYAEFIKSDPRVESAIAIPRPWHTTNIFNFPTPTPSTFLTALLQRRGKQVGMIVETAYPNFGLIGEDGQKAVVFHHGHFMEDIYLLMSVLKTMIFPETKFPEDIWDWEEENFAWIDYFWSTLGRSGEVGEGVDHIYERLQDEGKFDELLENLARGLAGKFDIPLFGETGEAKLFNAALRAVANAVRRMECKKPNGVLDCEEGFNKYLGGPLKRQIENELKGPAPPRISFVFGHTHKPFEEDRQIEGYERWVKVYNTGGWVVDSPVRRSFQGGAVVLVDENLDTATLRMYNEMELPDEFRVRVSEAGHPGDSPGEFYSRIQQLFRENPAPFEDFSDTVVREINIRRWGIQARIDSPGA